MFFILFTLPGQIGSCNFTSKDIFIYINIFSGSLQTTSVAKILSSYCHRYIYEYIPHRELWINRLYFKISNSTEKEWLTIDTCDVNNLEPSKFRTDAENGHQQICYFNRNKEDKIFNRFLVARKETSADEIFFSIANLIDKSNNLEKACYKIDNELTLFGTGDEGGEGGWVQNSPPSFSFLNIFKKEQGMTLYFYDF